MIYFRCSYTQRIPYHTQYTRFMNETKNVYISRSDSNNNNNMRSYTHPTSYSTHTRPLLNDDRRHRLLYLRAYRYKT